MQNMDSMNEKLYNDLIEKQREINSQYKERFTCQMCEKIFFSTQLSQGNRSRHLCYKCLLKIHF